MTYDELFTFENLFRAHLKARTGKRNKKDVIDFELNLSANLWDLYNRLAKRNYAPKGYNKFYIYEPKMREIQALAYYDRIVQHCLCDNYLYPLLTSKFVYDNCACQKGKGTDFAYKRLTLFMRRFYRENNANGYMLKADVRHYFPSIDHAVLKELIAKVVDDKDIFSLLCVIIDSFENEPGKGIPMGNQTSQLFALFYLNKMDRLIKEQLHIKYYTRYMDDCVLIHRDKNYLRYCLMQMDLLLEDELNIEFNEKTQIFPIKNGVDYLGFHFYLTDSGKVVRKLRQSSKKRFKKRLKTIAYDYSVGKKDLDDVKRSLAGFKGHLSRGHTYSLRRHAYSSFLLVKKG